MENDFLNDIFQLNWVDSGLDDMTRELSRLRRTGWSPTEIQQMSQNIANLKRETTISGPTTTSALGQNFQWWVQAQDPLFQSIATEQQGARSTYQNDKVAVSNLLKNATKDYIKGEKSNNQSIIRGIAQANAQNQAIAIGNATRAGLSSQQWLAVANTFNADNLQKVSQQNSLSSDKVQQALATLGSTLANVNYQAGTLDQNWLNNLTALWNNYLSLSQAQSAQEFSEKMQMLDFQLRYADFLNSQWGSSGWSSGGWSSGSWWGWGSSNTDKLLEEILKRNNPDGWWGDWGWGVGQFFAPNSFKDTNNNGKLDKWEKADFVAPLNPNYEWRFDKNGKLVQWDVSFYWGLNGYF